MSTKLMTCFAYSSPRVGLFRQEVCTLKIALIAPYQRLADEAQQVCRTYGERIDIAVGAMDDGVREGRKAVREGAWALISRGGTWMRLCQEVQVPVVEIAVTPYDIMRTFQKARSQGTRFGVVGSKAVLAGLKDWYSLLKVPVFPVETSSDAVQSRAAIERAVAKHRIDCLLGDARAMEHASGLSVPLILIESGKEAIWAAIQEAKRIVAARVFETSQTATPQTALDKTGHGLLLIDNGIVQYANRVVLELLGTDNCAFEKVSTCLPMVLQDFLNQDSSGPSSDMLLLSGKLWIVERTLLAGLTRQMVSFRQLDSQADHGSQSRLDTSRSKPANRTFDDFVGQSSRVRLLVQRAAEFALSDSTVLIVGETGTGKEVLAQSIHNASPRSFGPFVAVNCAALPEQLLESELFGYESGAFTGARRNGKPGLFELAHGGTIFLDEIADAPFSVQQRLLRVLQEREVMRIGGDRVISVDVRVIAATNKPLRQLVDSGKFRNDLFFRLDVLRLNTVALRDRSEDIPELLGHLMRDVWYRRKGVGAAPKIDPEIYPLLCSYDWPGNVRELENMVEYLISVCHDRLINHQLIEEWFATKLDDGIGSSLTDTWHTPHTSQGLQSPQNQPALQPMIPVTGTLEDMERQIIETTLEYSGGDVSKASRTLGVNRTTLWRKLKQWHAEEPSSRK